MEKKKIASAGMLYLIATLFNKGISFITVPIFSRLLSTSDYGIVTTFNSWVAILSVAISMSLYMAVRSSFQDYSEESERKTFLSTVVTFTAIATFIIICIVLICTAIIPINVNIALIMLCIVQSFGMSLLNDYSYYLMMQYRYKARTALLIVPNLTSAVLSVLVIKFVISKDLYYGRIVPTTFVYIITAVVIMMAVFSKVKPTINIQYLKYGLKISLPLVLHGIALNILSQSDRTMITVLRNSSETGIYSLIYNMSMLATVITSSLDGIWVPWFTSKLVAKDVETVNKRAIDYIQLMTLAMASIILVGPEILKVFADERYWEGKVIIPPIVLANYIIFMYTLYVNVEHFYKKTIYITINTVIAAVTNIIMNYIFIPKYGYIAAAYTTLSSYLISFVLHSGNAKKLEPSIYPFKMFIIPLVEIFVIMNVFYLAIDEWYIRWMILALICILVFFFNFNRIVSHFSKR